MQKEDTMKIRTSDVMTAACLAAILLSTVRLATAQQPAAGPGPLQVTIKLADTEVEAAVREALRADPFVYPYPIAVSVADGSADLTGRVDTSLAKSRAGQVVSAVTGVKTVRNHLTIDPNLWHKSDAQIHEDVVQEFIWSPLVPADKIVVQVAEGVVTLHGEVNDLEAVHSATANAIQGGAKRVVNKLTIKPHPNITLGSPWRSLR
jgi:osmotically-inducible protein OsmY